MSPGEDRGPPHRYGRRLLILIGALLLFVVALVSVFPPAQWREGDGANIAYLVLFASIVILGVAGSRHRLSALAAQLAAWAVVLALLIVGYGYRFELQDVAHRFTGELLPSRGQTLGRDSVAYRRADDGHFWIDGAVDGKPVRFLLDTGASGVVLTRADAARLGFPVDRLSYSQIFETANGRTRGAPVELGELRLGALAFAHVPASVNEGELGQSLLGMRLLDRLSSVEIKGDTLTIHR